MIDIHSHILPGIDDGSKNIDETFNLIKEAQSAGFDSIVLTSHYIEGHYEASVIERENLTKSIIDNLEKRNIYGVKLYLGSEIYISENIMNLLENAKASTINNTSYVLFELPTNSEPIGLYNIIYEMMQNKFVPILAHPERYEFVQQNPQIVYDLIQRGVLMQANYGSIIGQYGKRAQLLVKKMIENDMIHFLASDAHRENIIYTKIPQILSNLKKLISQNKIDRIITENPMLALQNKKIYIDEPMEIKFSFKEKWTMKFRGQKMKLNIVMVEPEIPQNTGNIARTCAITGAKLHLVYPLGFKIDDKYLKRAGLDYWDKLEIEEHDSLQNFLEKYNPEKHNMFFATTKAQHCYTDIDYNKCKEEIFILFGKETKGLPEDLLQKYIDKTIRIPMRPVLRSLNLSNSVCIISYEILRQIGFEGLEGKSTYFKN